MSLMKMSHKSLHGVIRTAAMAIQDTNFQLLEFLNMFPAQVGTSSHVISEDCYVSLFSRGSFVSLILSDKNENSEVKIYW